MANRWSDGFGRYGGDEAKMLNGSSSQAWAQIDTGATLWNLSSTRPRTGSWHMRLLGNDGFSEGVIARRVFGDQLTEVFLGHALYFDQLPILEPTPGGAITGFFIAKFRTQANEVMVTVWLGTDGSIVVYRGGDPWWVSPVFALNSGTSDPAVLLGRSSPCVGAGAYVHFEHYLKVGNSTGAYELRVNEVTVLNLTGIDTDNGGGEVSQFTIGRQGAPFASGKYIDMADCYVNDTTDDGSGCNTFVGDVKSGILMVNGDTAQADFALSTGVSGYQLLDDIPPDDADYISLAATTGESDFALANGPANLSEILTARPFYRAMKDDAGTCTVAPNLKSNSVKATIDDQPLTTAFAYVDSNVPFDPDTGVPWTASGLNAALEVVERIS
jgi:hypothetical protein